MDELRAKVRERLARASSVPVRVLVAGPIHDSGGLARMARMSVTGFNSADAVVSVFDTSKDTPQDRSFARAVWSHLRRAWRFARSVRRERPHVVHLHTCSFRTFERTIIDCAICAVLGRKFVLHVHGGLFDRYLTGQTGLRLRWVQWALRRAERVIVLGQVWQRTLTHLCGGLRVEVLPNALEPDVADAPPANHHRSNLETGSPLTEELKYRSDRQSGLHDGCVLFVGDFSEVKRPEDLIVAYASLPKRQRRRFRLTMVGQGDARREALIKRMAADIAPDDDIQFTGRVEGRAAQQLMRDSDLVVIPSRAEGLPLVLLEAMRSGAAIVTTDVGAVREVVTDGVNAKIVEPLNPEQLALAIKHLLDDRDRCAALGDKACARAKAFSADAFRAKLLNIWRGVAAEDTAVSTPPVPHLASPTFRSLL